MSESMPETISIQQAFSLTIELFKDQQKELTDLKSAYDEIKRIAQRFQGEWHGGSVNGLNKASEALSALLNETNVRPYKQNNVQTDRSADDSYYRELAKASEKFAEENKFNQIKGKEYVSDFLVAHLFVEGSAWRHHRFQHQTARTGEG